MIEADPTAAGPWAQAGYLEALDDCMAPLMDDIAPLADKWAAFRWNVIEVENGNDPAQVRRALIEIEGK